MKEFDLESLSKSDGKDGNPIYVAHGGKVYDVSESKLWQGGLHMKRHPAGRDLTGDIQAAPHGSEVFERYPQVGVLKAEGEMDEREMPAFLSRPLERFPILRRHPHPMVVHFPIVFMYSTTIFTLLYLVTGARAFEITALHCLGGGILFTPVAILTGWFTWWLNYMAKSLRPVTIKKRVSMVLMGAQMIAFGWRILDPDVLSSFGGASLFYLLLVLSFIPLVTITGWYGAMMTFPIHRG